MSRKARILLYDLETSSNVAHVWGHYEQNVLAYVKEWEILSVGWKWLGDSGVQVKTRADCRDKSDKALVQHLHGLLSAADIVVGHNSVAFDNKKANARFAFYNLQPAAPFKNVDTLLEARKAFKFNSNKLDDLAQHLGLGAKVKTGGFGLWKAAQAGDKEALTKMGKYNRQDVVLLEKVYKRLRPYMASHPNVSLISTGNKDGCPNCGSQVVKKDGIRANSRTFSQQMKCLECGRYYLVPVKKVVA